MKKVLLVLQIMLICLVISVGSVFAGAAAKPEKAGTAKPVEAQVKISGPGDELKKLNDQVTALQTSAFVNNKKADKQKELLLKEITETVKKVENGEYNIALKNLKTDFEKSIRMWISKAEQTKLFKSIDSVKASINNASKTTVKTAYGKVAGADANNGSWVWAGIPYAKPPVGELRWKAPQDPESWNKIRQSTYNFTRCTQPVFDLQWNPVNKIQGSEDCLYLNVFRPKTNAKNLPVYFWIHGGGNSFDGADSYDASILAQKSNMVVVVIQFRTGPFGWFNHPALNPNGTAEDKSGNYGVLDMIKALKWVNRNIAAFGGNPQNVTIAGESTGGYRVMNLMISPLAKGLFHKAINQSGGSTNIPVSMANDIVNAAIDKLLVTDGTCADPASAAAYRASMSNAQIGVYLRNKTSDEIERSVMTDTGALYITSPIADGTVLPGTVQEVFESGNYNHVPIIIGCNSDEQRPFVPSFLATVPTSSGHIWYNAFNVLGFYTPLMTMDEFMPPNSTDRELYDTCAKYSSLYWEAAGIDSIARILKKHQNDVYCYEFKWGGKGSGPAPFDFLIGAGHTFDLPFFFGWDHDCFGNISFTKENEKGRKDLQKSIMSYIASFASSGNPNKAKSGLPKWELWSSNAAEPKRIIFDADYKQAKISMMNEEHTKEDVLNQINSLPASLRDMIKALLWI